MTAIPVSEGLLRSCANSRRWEPSHLAHAYEIGAAPTQKASTGPRPVLQKMGDRFKSKFTRQWQRSPDKAASMRRKRQLGGAGGLPHTVRHMYTVGEAAVLVVIAGEHRKNGLCDLPIDRIAALAGVSRTTVQNAVRAARRHLHIEVHSRPRKGEKNLTNLIKIVAKDWLTWMERGSIGFKQFHPTKSHRNKQEHERVARSAEEALEREKAAEAAARERNREREALNHAAAVKAVNAALGIQPSQSDKHDGPTLDLKAVA